jgi:branched-chain amino acid transport system substrate-binding protein
MVISMFCGVVAMALSPSSRADIKIGLLTDFSGPQGAFGALYKDGVDFVLRQHGGKLGGQVVQLIVEDGAGDPATTITKAKKLVEQDKIDVLFGPINSATGAALKSYLVERKMPTLIQSTVDAVIDGKYMFRTSFASNADAFLEGYLGGKAGHKRAVIIASNYVSGQDAAKFFEMGFAAAGGTVVQKLMPRLGTSDYGPFIGQISSEVDVGIVFLTGADAVRFMQQSRGYDMKLPLFGYTSAVDESLLPAEGKAAIGFIGAATYFSTIDTPANHDFVRAWTALFPPTERPSWPGLGGYIAAAVLDNALTKLEGKVSDTDALLNAIKDVQIETPSGSFRFDENNNPVEPRYIAQIREIDGSIKPVVLGSIPEFLPVAAPPELPETLVLPAN